MDFLVQSPYFIIKEEKPFGKVQSIGFICLSQNFYYLFLFDMNDISYEEISVVIEKDAEIPIFDRDDWDEETGNAVEKEENDKLRLIESEESNCNENIKIIEKQIKETNENFFQIKVNNVGSKKPLGHKKENKLRSINKKNTNSVLRKGYAEKKTDGLIFKWHKRFLVLTCEKLFFFSDETKASVIGCINLKLLEMRVEERNSLLVLDFDGERENLILKINDPKDREEWKNWIEKVIDFHGKERKLKIKTIAKPFYSEKNFLTEKEFLRQTETGDVLLFYTNNKSANLQRFFTNSDFDHVAMVIKLGDNEPLIFQSTPTYGVSMFRWYEFILYFNLYQKVTLRKLNYLRKAEVQQSLIKVARNSLGKKYDIGALKMLKMESDFNWQGLKEEEQKKEARGYFCSELIAKCYKSVGLIESKKSSARYWPVDFSEKEGLLLKKGAWLGNQIPILLEKHVKKNF